MQYVVDEINNLHHTLILILIKAECELDSPQRTCGPTGLSVRQTVNQTTSSSIVHNCCQNVSQVV